MWFSRATAQHELLHLAQYMRSSKIVNTSPWRLIHEVIPCMLGPIVPNSLVVTPVVGAGGYLVSQVGLAAWEWAWIGWREFRGR